jgi:6,7-dimethyl-8-ribityllumazine synthase
MSSYSPEKRSTTGIPIKKDAFVVIVKTEWNSSIVDELENGCVKVLKEYGIQHTVIAVPGAFEIPYSIKRYWEMKQVDKSMNPDAFIALGCVLRGDTPHFDYVCKAVTDGILHLNLQLPLPTVFGVLTVDNNQQAMERIGGKHGHKGEEAAITALKMIAFDQSIKIVN